MAPATVSMRALLRKNTAFIWTPECQVEFKQMKSVLADEQFIKAFDPNLDTELLVDTSKVSGCGYILIQRTQEGAVHIIRCGSMAAKRGWAGMSPIESEFRGVGWAVEHCAYYLKGSSKVMKIVTDHFPLVLIFEKSMFDLSQRRWNVRSRLMDYKIQVCWIPGKQQMAADTLGRNQVWPGTADNSEGEDKDSGCEDACFIADEYKEECLFDDKFCDPMLEELFAAAKDNQAYQKVLVEVKKVLTNEALKLLPPDHPARAMTQQSNKIGIMQRPQDGLLVFQGSRIIVPRAARKKINEFLHLPHLGQRLTYQAGALCYWWPGGFREEIFKLVEAC